MGKDKEKKEKGKVYVDKGRVNVDVGKDTTVYGKGGGKPPSHDNPKGEKRGEVGIEWRFGGKGKDKKK